MTSIPGVLLSWGLYYWISTRSIPNTPYLRGRMVNDRLQEPSHLILSGRAFWLLERIVSVAFL